MKGGVYCNSDPTTICTTVLFEDDDTVAVPVYSDHYLFHTWTFHGTGFRAEPYIDRTSDNTFLGNRLGHCFRLRTQDLLCQFFLTF